MDELIEKVRSLVAAKWDHERILQCLFDAGVSKGDANALCDILEDEDFFASLAEPAPKDGCDTHDINIGAIEGPIHFCNDEGIVMGDCRLAFDGRRRRPVRRHESARSLTSGLVGAPPR